MIEAITAAMVQDEARLAETGAAAAGLASLRYVLFDRKSHPCPPGVHVALVQVACELRDRARFLRSFIVPRVDA